MPKYGCPKRMLNGPCGGGSRGICEVDDRRCVWVEAYIKALERQRTHIFEYPLLDAGFQVVDHEPGPREPRSTLMKMIVGDMKPLIYEVELSPEGSLDGVADTIRRVTEAGFDAVTMTDSPLGAAGTDPLAPAAVARFMLGVETAVHVTCRDRSRSALVSWLLAVAGLGVGNVIVSTGDWPLLHGDNRWGIHPVFDLDSARLVYLARLITDLHVDHLGRRLSGEPFFHVGVVANPYFDPLELEVLRLLKKQRAGAEFVITQPIYTVNAFLRLVHAARERGVETPFIASLAPLKSYRHAVYLAERVGVEIPEDYREGLKRNEVDGNIWSYNVEYMKKLTEALAALEEVSGILFITHGIHGGIADLAIDYAREASRILK